MTQFNSITFDMQKTLRTKQKIIWIWTPKYQSKTFKHCVLIMVLHTCMKCMAFLFSFVQPQGRHIVSMHKMYGQTY